MRKVDRQISQTSAFFLKLPAVDSDESAPDVSPRLSRKEEEKINNGVAWVERYREDTFEYDSDSDVNQKHLGDIKNPEIRIAVDGILGEDVVDQARTTGESNDEPLAPPGEASRQCYAQVCHYLQIVPLREIRKQFGNKTLCLKSSILGPKDIKALSNALLIDTYVKVLDLSSIAMDLKMIQYISLMLLENRNITDLIIADNQLSSPGIKCVAEMMKQNGAITFLNVAGNKLRDCDSSHIEDIISNNSQLNTLNLSHNEFREDAGKILGQALARNSSLTVLDLSWNHLRCKGAIDIANGIQHNSSIHTLNLGWNGFAYGGALAMGEALQKNTTLTDLDLTCNRIHPPAMLEFMKGFLKNKTLIRLNLSDNPITPVFTAVLLAGIRDSLHLALKYLILDGIVVDEEFINMLKVIEAKREFYVYYESALPLNRLNRANLLQEYERKKEVFTLDPIEMLYLLKEKMRAVDFFWKLDKDKTNTVTNIELHALFKEAGIPATQASVAKAMAFIDQDGDGLITMNDFITADRKIKRYSRAKAAKRSEMALLSSEKEKRYSQAYKGADFNAVTSKVELSGDKLVKKMVDAAMRATENNGNTLQVPSDSPLSPRNGKLTPISNRRRSSVTSLYDRRRSSLPSLDRNSSNPSPSSLGGEK